MMKPHDSVASAIAEIQEGQKLDIAGVNDYRTRKAKIEFGYKFAVRHIKNSEDIIKYGEVIGVAIAGIEPGISPRRRTCRSS